MHIRSREQKVKSQGWLKQTFISSSCIIYSVIRPRAFIKRDVLRRGCRSLKIFLRSVLLAISFEAWISISPSVGYDKTMRSALYPWLAWLIFINTILIDSIFLTTHWKRISHTHFFCLVFALSFDMNDTQAYDQTEKCLSSTISPEPGAVQISLNKP